MNCWLQITSARGPEECSRATFHIMQILLKEAEKRNIKVTILKSVVGRYPKTIKSVLLSLDGKEILDFVTTWEGTVLWIEKSPFRPLHKRKNWYVGINKFIPPEESLFLSKDFRIEAMKASGPGGQHVNKSSTAIRITHIPSGMVATAQEERSQYMNRKLALARLLKLIDEKCNAVKKKSQQKQWEKHNDLERGNPVRTFKI